MTRMSVPTRFPFKRTDVIARFVDGGRPMQRVIIASSVTNRPVSVAVCRELLGAISASRRASSITELINRGGSLLVDGMQFANHPYQTGNELLRDRGISPICGVAFGFLFVGYDGQYYLCSSDWEKKAPL